MAFQGKKDAKGGSGRNGRGGEPSDQRATGNRGSYAGRKGQGSRGGKDGAARGGKSGASRGGKSGFRGSRERDGKGASRGDDRGFGGKSSSAGKRDDRSSGKRGERNERGFGSGRTGGRRGFSRDGKRGQRRDADSRQRFSKPSSKDAGKRSPFGRNAGKYVEAGAAQEAAEGGVAADDGAERERKWVPNREPRKVKSKKDFDRERMDAIGEEAGTVYRGELDPRDKDPNRKPRSISRSEQKVMRKAEVLAEQHAAAAGTTAKLASHTDFRDLFETCEASPARLAALYATQQVRRRNAYAQEVIEASIDTARISPEDRAFATLLTLGVVSTSGALDDVINRCIASPRDIQPDVRDAMRISTYEIIFLRKAPHAALDQGVELVRAVAPAASRLGNAVLHRVLEAQPAFPFGDPATDIDALALLYGFPVWLAKRLVADMGAQAAATFMQASNDPAPLFVSVNSLQATDEEVCGLLREVGAEVEPASAGGVSPAGCYRVSNARVLADGRVARLFSQGKMLVSDAAAQAVAHAVLEDGLPGTLLEVGAGRGTKTLLLQNMANRAFGEQANIVSLDSHGFKTDLLRERARTYGARIDELVTGNGARLDSVMGDRSFDCVFIDAPCSGLGTLRRHHEIRWRLKSDQITDMADVGLLLLKSAAGHVNPGGRIVYSTCTVAYDENNGVVKRFLESPEGAGFKLAPIAGKACFTSQLAKDPKGSPDAHFAAKFVRA